MSDTRALKTTPVMKPLDLGKKSNIPAVESKNLIMADADKMSSEKRGGDSKLSPNKKPSPEKVLIPKTMTITKENIDFSEDAAYFLSKLCGNRVTRSTVVNELLSILREEHDKKGEEGRLYKDLVKRLSV
jgi:hypothetical protein